MLAEIKKIVPQGVDLAVESSGMPAVMEQAVNATRQQGGRAVVIGNARHGSMLSLNPGGLQPGQEPARHLGRRQRSRPRLWPLRPPAGAPDASRCGICCRSRIRLDEADQALQDLAAGKVGRPLIDMSLRRSG